MAIFGQTAAGIHLTLLAANSLTIILFFCWGETFRGGRRTCACASYAVMSASPWFGNGGARESFCGFVRRAGYAAVVEWM